MDKWLGGGPGPIDECVLEGVRRSNRNKPIDVQTLGTSSTPRGPNTAESGEC